VVVPEQVTQAVDGQAVQLVTVPGDPEMEFDVDGLV